MTPLILLHGALGSAAQFDGLRRYLPADWPVFTLDFPGHGGLPADEPYSMSRFTDAVLHFMQEKNIPQADIFGYSMGGYAALYLAWKQPDKVRRIFTLGTKFAWNPETAARETAMLDPVKIETKVPVFAQTLAERHAPADWKTVLQRTAGLLCDLGEGKGLPPEAFARIACPIAIGLGELDNMVTAEESREVAGSLPKGRFDLLSGCKHPIEQVNFVLLTERLKEFFR